MSPSNFLSLLPHFLNVLSPFSPYTVTPIPDGLASHSSASCPPGNPAEGLRLAFSHSLLGAPGLQLLPLLASDSRRFFFPPPHSFISSWFSLLSHLLSQSLTEILPEAQDLALLLAISAHLVPDNSFILRASAITYRYLMMLISITSISKHLFR